MCSYFAPDDSGLLRILAENEWRGVGITQSLGWEHFEVHGQSHALPCVVRIIVLNLQRLSPISVSLHILLDCAVLEDIALSQSAHLLTPVVLFRRSLVSLPHSTQEAPIGATADGSAWQVTSQTPDFNFPVVTLQTGRVPVSSDLFWERETGGVIPDRR
jgi:hypothetical protein